MDPFMKPNINFCEGRMQKNLISNNIEELLNSFSSLIFCFFSLCLWHKLDKRFLQLSTPIAMNFIVGLGSFLFHSKGIRLFQFLDEIPMIITISSGIIIYHEELHQQDKLKRIPYNIMQSLVCGLQTITIIANIYSKYFYIFEGLFMTFCIWICALVYISSTQNNKYFAKRTICLGFMGYGIWLIDQHYCNNYTTWFHFHMWWHIFISIVVYNIMELYKCNICNREKIPYQSKMLLGIILDVSIQKNGNEKL